MKKNIILIVFVILLNIASIMFWLDHNKQEEKDNFCLNSKIKFDSRIMDQMMGNPVKAIDDISETFQLYPFSDTDYVKYFGADLQDITLKKLRDFQVELQENKNAIQFKTDLEILYKKYEGKIIKKMCQYLPVDSSFIFRVLYVNFIHEKVLYEKDSIFILNPSSKEWKGNVALALEMIIHNAVHIALQQKISWPTLIDNSRAFDKLNFLKQEVFFEGIASFISYQVKRDLDLQSNSYFSGGGGEFDFDGISDKLKTKQIIRKLINDSRDLIKENDEVKFKEYFDENGGKHYITGAYIFNVIEQKQGVELLRKIINSGNADMLFEIYNQQVPDEEKIIILTDNFL